MLYEKFDELIKRATEVIKNYYGSNLVSLVLFGSCSRKTQHYHSDIDLLIILSDSTKGKMVRLDEFMENIDNQLESELMLLKSQGIITDFSPIIKTQQEIKKGHLLLYEMTESCQILFDKNKFMTNFLSEMKEKMKLSGVIKNNHGHWIMPTDIFSKNHKEDIHE